MKSDDRPTSNTEEKENVVNMSWKLGIEDRTGQYHGRKEECNRARAGLEKNTTLHMTLIIMGSFL